MTVILGQSYFSFFTAVHWFYSVSSKAWELWRPRGLCSHHPQPQACCCWEELGSGCAAGSSWCREHSLFSSPLTPSWLLHLSECSAMGDFIRWREFLGAQKAPFLEGSQKRDGCLPWGRWQLRDNLTKLCVFLNTPEKVDQRLLSSFCKEKRDSQQN